MRAKRKEFKKALALRRKGYSLNEIHEIVRVAKSTLSLWLRETSLSKKQKLRLTQKRVAAAKKGWEKVRQMRIARTTAVKDAAKAEVPKLSPRELFVIGVVLYWAEGRKEKEWSVSTGVKFSNSDAQMLRLFIKWLKEICDLSLHDIKFEIYIHQNSFNGIEKVKKYWAGSLNVPVSMLQTVYFKKHKQVFKRHNIGGKYYGLVRINVKKSTDFNRKISGWIEGICQQLV